MSQDPAALEPATSGELHALQPFRKEVIPPDSIEPLVSCIMLTCWPERNQVAHAAIRSFLMQTWKSRELVIINNSYRQPDEYRLLDQVDYGLPARYVREIMVEYTDKMTVGDLRNLGLEACCGDWFLAWDDDDWSHPERIEYMMERRQPGMVLVPSAHVRYSFKTNSAFVYENKKVGAGNIVLYPRTSRRFPAMIRRDANLVLGDKGEDNTHMHTDWEGRFVIWENREVAHHYLRFFHGGNLSEEQQVMRKYCTPRYRGVWMRDWRDDGFMRSNQTEYLKFILRNQYDHKIDGKPWPDDLDAQIRAEIEGTSPVAERPTNRDDPSPPKLQEGAQDKAAD